MTSPLTMVLVLTVLWLIVVVPMIVRRADGGSDSRPDEVPRRSGSGRRRVVALSGTADLEVPVTIDSELSHGRRAMLSRRRRALAVLGVGSAVTLLLAAALGGTVWLLSAPFVLGLAGYLAFLRNRAVSDRERRALRQTRASGRGASVRSEGTRSLASRFDDSPDSAVRIDDDDVAFHTLDTVDLTGLYEPGDVDSSAGVTHRRAG